MKKEIQNKIQSCKALQDKTVLDIINSERFHTNLAAYWEAQKEDRKAIRKSYDAMRKLGGVKGYKIPAHVIDDLQGLSVNELAEEFLLVIRKESRRPVAERTYIMQLCQQAYNLTISQIVVEEFPELKEILIPKPKQN